MSLIVSRALLTNAGRRTESTSTCLDLYIFHCLSLAGDPIRELLIYLAKSIQALERPKESISTHLDLCSGGVGRRQRSRTTPT